MNMLYVYGAQELILMLFKKISKKKYEVNFNKRKGALTSHRSLVALEMIAFLAQTSSDPLGHMKYRDRSM